MPDASSQVTSQTQHFPFAVTNKLNLKFQVWATTVKQVYELFFSKPLNKTNLIRLIEIPVLSPIWAEVAKTR
ncbi:hypothetical protein [Moritella yayanosii]|uniref:hypothetical protein n=1 Tax=Moritella yayanosii TaxID=69539 RepID=UPI0018D54B18|nr:hypothetical protein [Moritella yayanosii]